MKEISLKKPAEKIKNSGELAMPTPRDSYPSFSVYDYASEDLMKIPMGKEVMAKIRKSSEDTHKGDKSRNSCGFEVISVLVKDDDMMKKLMDETNVPEQNKDSVMKKYKG